MIKKITIGDLKQAVDLVNEVFSEFVAADYSEQGKNTFEAYLKNKYEEILGDINSGYKKMWAYYQDDKILGVISTKEVSHISLLFVDKRHHRKGIARQLFNVVLDDLRKSGGVTEITVNSSPYAVKVYERFGFVKTEERQEKDGIIFIPMKRPL